MTDDGGRRRPLRVVVMGVSGSGKTTIGRLLADRLGADFVDADDAHPAANIAKMERGEPLDDADRAPWLARLRGELAGAPDDVVVTSSALKRSYRDVLREAGGVAFVLLDVDPATAEERVAGRAGHFMPASLVESQFDALQPPQPDEHDVAVVDATPSPDAVVDAVLAAVSE